LEHANTSLGYAILPVAANSTKCQLLGVCVTGGTEQLRRIDTVVRSYATDSDPMTFTKGFEGLFRLKHLPRILTLMHGKENQATMMVDPNITKLVVGRYGRAFTRGDNAWAASLELISRHTVAGFEICTVDRTGAICVRAARGLPI
jgi:hypothetical protein